MSLKIIPTVLALIAVGLAAGFLWLAAEASPVFGGPALAGLALGDFQTGVRVAGRHLSCADAGPAAEQATCHLDVAGQRLSVEVVYADANRAAFSRCRAAYADRAVACEAAFLVAQGPAWAEIRDPAALGLTATDLTGLAARYPASTWSEGNWTWTSFLVALATALLLGLAVAGWIGGRLRARRFWITAGLAALASFFALTIGLMTVLSGLALID